MRKILIVDDEKIMLRIASKILSKEYETLCANSGAEAVEIFRRERPDMVLSDLLMPGMDGYELHRILQEQSAEAVPIIFMTADDSDESESRGLEVGAADYIRKPLKPDVLIGRVKNIFDRFEQIHGLTEAATVDQMTGLLNKTAAQREISKLCAESDGVLLELDLDSFKLVNDLYGHAMGDKVLIGFAELLKSQLNLGDMAGRTGGDEFIAFCRAVHDERTIFKKARLLNGRLMKLARELMGSEIKISLGVSVGAVYVPDEGRDFAELTAKADKALYKVKHFGKHGCAFYGVENFDGAASKSIAQTQLLLSERDRESKAYVVNFEKFKAVYRYAVRQPENCPVLIQCIFETEDEDEREKFLTQLTESLNRGDCMTQIGREQFLILTTEAEAVRLKAQAAADNLSGELTIEVAEKI
ncbi:MAG: diguanylate cyclase [Selenomonadaceae bacterium]|nr:diguanylate cyclase [Selenomonadaceae bacterium]